MSDVTQKELVDLVQSLTSTYRDEIPLHEWINGSDMERQIADKMAEALAQKKRHDAQGSDSE